MNLTKLAYLAQVVACFGVVPAMWGIFESSKKAALEEKQTQALLRLTAFPALDGIIQRDRDERRNVERAAIDLRKFAGREAILERFETGRGAYYGIEGLAEAGRHYEYLGVMIRLGYVEFQPIFEVVSFPDDLWDELERSGLLTLIREENWTGDGRPLPDFWVNFEFLRDCYYAARQGKPIPGEEPEPTPWFDLPALLDRFRSGNESAPQPSTAHFSGKTQQPQA